MLSLYGGCAPLGLRALWLNDYCIPAGRHVRGGGGNSASLWASLCNRLLGTCVHNAQLLPWGSTTCSNGDRLSPEASSRAVLRGSVLAPCRCACPEVTEPARYVFDCRRGPEHPTAARPPTGSVGPSTLKAVGALPRCLGRPQMFTLSVRQFFPAPTRRTI